MSSSTRHVGFLDGLRGFAALWVIAGHAMILTGFDFPIVSLPDLAVDLFILISGFLMTFNYIGRQAVEPWAEPDTWKRFWVRRFFRIAPLYYAALIAALVAGPWLGEARHAIASLAPASVTEDARYFDQSLTNLLMHASFLFGLSPAYHFRTALPDWSIGLEMQYYLAFPFLMLLVGRLGWLRAAPIIAAGGIAAGVGVSHLGAEFAQPAFLGLKLQVFLAGMLLAASLESRGRHLPYFALAIGALVLLPIGGVQDHKHALVRLALAAAFFVLLHRRRLPRLAALPVDGAARLLAGGLGRALGELSYGAYLIHLMVMLPVIGWLSVNEPALRHGTRFLIGLAIVLPVTYALAALAHFAIEKPGIALGRSLLRAKPGPALVSPAVSELPPIAATIPPPRSALPPGLPGP